MSAINRDRVSHIQGIDPLNSAKRVLGIDTPDLGGVARLREVGLALPGLEPVVAKNPGPLLDGLVVVWWEEGTVD